MRRSKPMSRGNGLRRRGRRTPVDTLPRKFFREAAVAQRVCAACGVGGDCDAHHVVYEQHVRAEGGNVWDPRNALRLCRECHQRHHAGYQQLHVAVLTAGSIAFAFELLGAAAADYLARRYAGAAADPRIAS